MRLLLINPNTSADMTAAILAAGRAALPANAGDVAIDAVQPERGPASIEGQLDEVVSAHWALDAVLPIADRYDGFIVACYSLHPLIGALREVLDQPVVGIMEASILYALPLGGRFSIVTTSLRWQPLLTEGVRALGFEQRCASVRSSGLSVLELGSLPADLVRQRLCDEAVAAVQRDGASVICLGCAGMAGLEAAVSAASGVPVIDGVRAGVLFVRALVEARAHTSKHGLYSPPLGQAAIGLPPGIAPSYAPSRAATPPVTTSERDGHTPDVVLIER
jgi:allantoin racemase